MPKEYKAEKLIKSSRYQQYYPQLSENIKQKTIIKVEQYIKENTQYCDKGNYNHLNNIFTSMALYEILEKEYDNKEKAYEIVSTQMWAYVEKKSGKFQKIFKLPYSLKIIGILLPKLFEIGSGTGWKYTWHKDKSTNNYLQFECNECIYQKIFKKYNKEELGELFCHADDINYGNLPNIKFTRQHTLCKDGEDCDFLFTKE